jgi:hypothetical protein
MKQITNDKLKSNKIGSKKLRIGLIIEEDLGEGKAIKKMGLEIPITSTLEYYERFRNTQDIQEEMSLLNFMITREIGYKDETQRRPIRDLNNYKSNINKNLIKNSNNRKDNEPENKQSTRKRKIQTEEVKEPKRIKTQYTKILEELSKPIDEEIEKTHEEEENKQEGSLVKMFNEAMKIEYKGILEWYNYGRQFLKEIDRRKIKAKRKPEQIIRAQIYEEMRKQMPNMTDKAIKDKTCKAVKIYRLFHRIGKKRIKQLKTVSAWEIAELNYDEIEMLIEDLQHKEESQNPEDEELTKAEKDLAIEMKHLLVDINED